MSECNCGETFRTAEDYRDHLPCVKPEEIDRIKQLELENHSLREEIRLLEAELRTAAAQIERMDAQLDDYRYSGDDRW